MAAMTEFFHRPPRSRLRIFLAGVLRTLEIIVAIVTTGVVFYYALLVMAS